MGERLARSEHHVLLLGPRQVGKSTLCRSLNPRRTINLMRSRLQLAYAKDPERLARELAACAPGLVVIDEIQRVPALLDTVQTVVDEPDCPFRFILTGSSARKLRRGGANLLPGRVVLEMLTPFSLLELGDDFDLQHALQVGMLPGIYLDRHGGVELLGSYAEIYLREEIQAEALTKNLGAYARFLDTVAASSGHWLNYSKLSVDSEIPKETLRRYVSVLEDTLVAHRLPAYRPARHVSRRVVQRERLLLFDVGVRNALLGRHQVAPSPADIGLLFEHWLILQVIALVRGLRKPWKLSSYRTQAGAEVDLVIETPEDVIGIEIKAGRQIARSALSGLRSLGEIVPRSRRYSPWVVYTGERAQRFPGGFAVKPYRQALLELAER